MEPYPQDEVPWQEAPGRGVDTYPFHRCSGTRWLSQGLLELDEFRFDCKDCHGCPATPHVVILGPVLSGTTTMHTFALRNYEVTLGEAGYNKDRFGNPQPTKGKNNSGCIILEDQSRFSHWKEFRVALRLILFFFSW